MPISTTSIADELFSDLGEPTDTSVAVITAWLEVNIGQLNAILNRNFYIDGGDILNADYDASDPDEETNGSEYDFTIVEVAIFKLVYFIRYYQRQANKALGSGSLEDNWVRMSEGDSSVQRTSRAEIAKGFRGVVKENEEMLRWVVGLYKVNKANPAVIDALSKNLI